MSILDWILSFLGLAGFAIFLYILASFVPEPDLLTVIAITFAMAFYDFWIHPFVRRRRR